MNRIVVLHAHSRCSILSRVRVGLVWLLLLMASTTSARAETVRDILKDLRERGMRSPAEEIERLERASGIPGPEAPVEARRLYHAELASLYSRAGREQDMQREIAALQALADSGKCAKCAAQILVVRSHDALRRHRAEEARRLLEQVATLPPVTDPQLRINLHMARGVAHDIRGDHTRAIAEAAQAGRIAAAEGFPVEQARALNLLMMANLAMGDLARAEKAAEDAYALAERIGYTYLQASLRSNQGVMYGKAKDYARQYEALMDALRITRADPGLLGNQSIVLGNLALYHLGQEEWSQAVVRADEAIEIGRKAGNQRAAMLATIHKGVAQGKLGQAREAIATLQHAHELATRSKSDGDRVTALRALAVVHREAGFHREAYENLEKAVELKEAIANAERQNASMLAQEQFSAVVKDHEIQRLSLENAKRSAEVTAHTWRQRLWATMAVALALGAAVLVQGLKLLRRRNQQLEARNATLAQESSHDPLTGTYNRRYCQVLIDQRQARHRSAPDEDESTITGLMLLDIDFFKQVNDTYGHAAGDVILVELARRLRQLVRQHDAVVRWGGEEFLLVLPGMTAPGLVVLAQRVLQAMAGEAFILQGRAIRVTASLGCVSQPFAPTLSLDDALHVADLALYLSKSGGRNRATCLMSVSEHLSLERLLSDLGAAHAEGDVRLSTVTGPEPAPGMLHGHALAQ